MMGKPNGYIFFLKMMNCYKNIVLFEIKSALTKKKEFIASLSTTKNLKTKIKPQGNEVIDFYDKQIPKVDSNQFSSSQFRSCSQER